jgi:hypothetical protein
MSLLPAEVSAQLVQLLQQLQSADNNVRSQAEDVLQNQWTSQRPDWLLMGLAEQIATSANPSVCRTFLVRLRRASMLTRLLPQLRSYAAVIFRRIASKTRKIGNSDNVDMFISLDKEHGTIIRGKILETLVTESDKTVRNRISDAVAELARQYYDSSASPYVAWEGSRPVY